MRDRGDMNLGRIAAFCEVHFDEWGHKSAILKRFRNLLWEGAVMHILRRAALEADEKEKSKRLIRREGTLTITGPLQPSIQEGVGTPASLLKKYLDPVQRDNVASAFVNRAAPAVFPMDVADTDPLIVDITKTRTSVHTDKMLEYRVVVNPTQLVNLAAAGLTGKHPEPSSQATQAGTDGMTSSQRTTKKPPAEPYDNMPLWISASIMRQVHPKLVEAFNARKAKAPGTRVNKGKRRARSEDLTDNDDDESVQPRGSQAKAMPGQVPLASQKAFTPSTSQRASTPIPSLGASTPIATPGPSKLRKLSVETSSAPQARVLQPVPRLPTTPARSPAPASRPTAPVFPRIFYNVGLIETEEALLDNTFLFTYTDPDDPDYLFEDEDEPTDGLVEVPEVPELPVGPTRMRISASQPQPAPVLLPPIVRLPQTQPGAPVARRPQPNHSRSPAPRQPTQPIPERVDDAIDEWEDGSGSSRNITALSRYDNMFDQILGIVPGATRRKPKLTTRARALGMSDIGGPSGSQQPRKRRTPTAVAAAAPPASQVTAINAVPQPSQRVAPYPELPPLTAPSQASGSIPPRPRPRIHRDADIVILDSDDEHPEPPKPSGSTTHHPPWNNSQNTVSSQESNGVDRFARLS